MKSLNMFRALVARPPAEHAQISMPFSDKDPAILRLHSVQVNAGNSLLLIILLFLTACSTTKFNNIEHPQNWQQQQNYVAPEQLKNWWQHLDDPILNQLIYTALKDSPDRTMAKARVLEARGIRRSTFAALFPQIDGTAEAGKQDNLQFNNNEFFEAGFDARFEIDLFGRNRFTDDAAQQQLFALQADYQNTTLTLIAEIARVYSEYIAAQHQVSIAKSNLKLQQKTLELVENLYKFGEIAELDVNRAKNVVETTRASIPLFQQQQAASRLQLSVLTGTMPDDLQPVLAEKNDLPALQQDLFLLSPADVLQHRPDVQAAGYNLAANTKLTQATISNLFPRITLSGFYGIADNSFNNTTDVWNIIIGSAVSLIDFGRIRGQIDAAKAREMQAYQLYRKTVLQAVTEVETALNAYSNTKQRMQALQNATNAAQKAFEQAQILYKEGEIAFLNVLDSQRTLNTSESQLITAQAEHLQSVIALYKALGVY